MRIAVAGGGPAGLFLGSLLRRADTRHVVDIFDRNPRGATYGFGVVFSDRTLEYLRQADATTHAAVMEHAIHWDDIELRLPGAQLRCGGHGFAAIARRELLEVLQDQALAAGAALHFEQEATAAVLDGYDLVVAAEGSGSQIRGRLAARLGTRISTGTARFIWFGTTRRYDALTFIFRRSDEGAFGVHAYPFGEGLSTFIVETDEATWRRAGLDRHEGDALAPGESDDDALRFCRTLFAEDLDGCELLANNSKWLAFPTVRNRRWSDGAVVLIGDAAHTAHFSVGSGTKMAMEDAIALARSLSQAGEMSGALQSYERIRRPAVDHIQAVAEPSRVWWERFGRRLEGLPTATFTLHFHTRTGYLGRDSLRARDAAFVRELDAAAPSVAESGAAATGLSQPLRLRALELPNRLAVGAPATTAAAIAGMGLAGAGLVMSRPVATLVQAGAVFEAISGAHREPGCAGLAVGLHAVGADAECSRVLVAAAVDSEAALLDLDVDACIERGDLSTVEAARRLWPQQRPLAVHLHAAASWETRDERSRRVASFLAGLSERCVDLVCIAPATFEARRGPAGVEQLLLADLVRNDLGHRVVLAGGVQSADDAGTQLQAGRADLCWGRPQFASHEWLPVAAADVAAASSSDVAA